MARVWVKGYTKSDGTKVEGHYRDSVFKSYERAKKATQKSISAFDEMDTYKRGMGGFNFSTLKFTPPSTSQVNKFKKLTKKYKSAASTANKLRRRHQNIILKAK